MRMSAQCESVAKMVVSETGAPALGCLIQGANPLCHNWLAHYRIVGGLDARLAEASSSRLTGEVSE